MLSLYVLALLITIAISISLAIYGFRRYSEPEMAAFGYVMFSIALWAGGTAAATCTNPLGSKLFWVLFIYAGNQSAPVFFLIFILALTRSGTWYPDKFIPILFIIPSLSILFAGTNEIHHLLWTNVLIVNSTFAPGALVLEHGPWYPVELVYIYLVLAVGLICIIRSIMSVPGVFNRQMGIILIGSLIPVAGSIMYTYFGPVVTHIDITSVLFSCTGLLCWYAITRHGLFDLFPALYEQIFSSMQEGVIILDHKRRIISLNPSAQTFTNLSESVIGEEAVGALRSWQDIGRLLGQPGADIEIRGSDDQWFQVRGYPVPSGHTGKDGYLIIISDITIKNKLRKNLEKTTEDIRMANVKLQLMSGLVRHDISNALTVIKSANDMMPVPPVGSVEHELLSMSREAAEKILNLIRFSNNYEKIGVQKPEWIDLHKIIDEERGMAPIDIRYENAVPPGTMIHSDPLIRIVIRNLIDNAIRHGGRITRIRFHLEETQDKWGFFCEDDGKGIAGDAKEKIFTRGYGGHTGMGLFFIREILSVGNMSISENGVEGKGARFVIDIPRDSLQKTDNNRNSNPHNSIIHTIPYS